ncbi:glycosyltransferase [Clostridium tyrobutyricum]|uniref:glycosyltransferase n=1 Tax=Clostridium tyrobutyricum TaxID=1519 RepID=UPI002B2158FB|nr:glycosyltransferase [Clostridium tyrobutyricum]MEA5007113.1 glycosyltransferase [Clostridium tyrobutyricum]
MKLCIITGTLPPIKCGVGDYTKILCNNLSQNEEIDLSVISTKGVEKNDKYKIYDICQQWDKKEIKNIIDKIYEINPDVINIQYPTSAYKKNIMINILPFFSYKKFKIVTTIHEYSDNSKLGKIRIWSNIFCSKAIIVVDKKYKKDIKKIPFFRNKEIYFINIGCNIPKSKITKQETQKIRHSILKNSCDRIMGYFGFVNKTKGIESIIYSMNILKQKNNLKTMFLIIGELKKDDEYHVFLTNLINKFNLNDYIYVTGYLKAEEVGKYINAADFMTLPFVNGLSTKNGSFLASIQEEKYIITTKKNNNEETIKDKNIFYLDRYNDVELLADIIEKNQNKKIFFYKNDYNYDDFTWSSIVNKYNNIYKRLL